MTYNTIFLRYGSAEHQANAILSFKTEKHYETKEQAKVSFAKSIVKACWSVDSYTTKHVSEQDINTLIKLFGRTDKHPLFILKDGRFKLPSELLKEST